jgi:hypothetical protein
MLIAAHEPPPFAGAVDPSELGEMRGGFTLPSGLEVALSVVTETALDGATLLRTQFTIADRAPTLQVFVGDGTAAGMREAGAASTAAGAVRPDITYNREQGLTVMPGTTSAIPFNINVGASSASAADPSLQQVEVAPGASVATPVGVVSHLQSGLLGRIELQADGLDTTHFYGSAFGSLTANTASDQAIDTVTSVTINLGNVSPDTLGSVLSRVEGLSVDSAQMLNR